MTGILESKIESYLVDQAHRRGFLCYKFTSPSTRGVPDRILVANGYVVFIELKAPGETPRKYQRHIHREMRAAGAIVLIIDSTNQIDLLLHLLAECRPEPKDIERLSNE